MLVFWKKELLRDLEKSGHFWTATCVRQEPMVVRWRSLGLVMLGLSIADARLATPSASRAAGSRRRSKAAPCQPAVSLSRDTSFLRSAVAGGAAACVATVAFHPVDTVKTMLQQHGSSAAGLRRSQLSARALYRGVGPAAFSMMPACAARMASYEALKASLLRAAPHLPQGPLVFLASALSVVASGVVRSPLDMVKVQLPHLTSNPNPDPDPDPNPNPNPSPNPNPNPNLKPQTST